MLREIVEIIRPKQWYKNIVIGAAIFFSKNITNADMLIAVVIGFFSLCMISSSSYVINDIVDAQADKNHDQKKHRPIPSGRLNPKIAIFLSILMLCLGLYLATLVNNAFLGIAAFLFGLISAYNFFIKNIAFADISLLSANFMVRAIAGAFAINVAPSPWLVLGTYLLALFLAIAKRKSDLQILGENAKKYKKVFEVYTKEFLEQSLLTVMGLLFITYCLYSFLSSAVHSVVLVMSTIPVVSFLIFRYYNFAISNHNMARRAEEIFTDKQMALGMLLWIMLFFISMYRNEISIAVNL
jgi:4-hydroxybenzoate polyprenyltransferase